MNLIGLMKLLFVFICTGRDWGGLIKRMEANLFMAEEQIIGERGRTFKT